MLLLTTARLRKPQHHNSQAMHNRAEQKPAVKLANPEELRARGLGATVRFFIDRAITLAVVSVARKHAQRARLSLTGSSGNSVHVNVFMAEGRDAMYVATTNDMCFLTGSSPSLYVMHDSWTELESAIYLFVSERLNEEEHVSAQIFRECPGGSDLPVIEATSDAGVTFFSVHSADLV